MALLLSVVFYLLIINPLIAVETILFTGNTQSYLEPCGCVQGMLGGIARRNKSYADEKDYILVDSGNFTDIKHELDRTRNDYYSRSFSALSYSVVGLSNRDLSRSNSELQVLDAKDLFVITNAVSSEGKKTFKNAKKSSGLEFISLVSPKSDVHQDWKILDPIQAVKEFELGERNLVLFSGLSKDELSPIIKKLKNRLVLVIANQSTGDFTKIEGIPVIFPGEKGKMVKKFSLKSGNYTSLAVLDTYEEDAKLKAIIDQFYQKVSNDPELQKGYEKLFGEDPHDKLVTEGKNRYVGSENCKTCHEPEYKQWKSTPHATAFNILLEKKRDFVPACVVCHSVGFGYESGYEISKRQKWLKGVGCESCHGAGLNHVRNPGKSNIAKTVDQSRCMSCHNAEHSPHFNYTAFTPLVNHSIKAIAEEVSSKPRKKQTTVDLDLYVMSQCPFGIKAQNKLLPMVEKYHDRINMNMRYIATDVEGKLSEQEKKARQELADEQKKKMELEATKNKEEESGQPGCKASFEIDPEAKFQSLHGPSEVDENIRQLIVSKLYPDQFLNFILERNKNIYGDWKAVAQRLKIDPSKIEAAMTDGRGDAWFRENIKPGNQMGISASPTIRINQEPYTNTIEATTVLYEICQGMDDPMPECKKVSMCSQDSHCNKKGKNGFCKNPGTPQAVCEFKDPVKVNLVMIRDDQCDLCESGRFLTQLYQVFPGLSVESYDRNSKEAQQWIKKVQADRFPLFVFPDMTFQDSPRVNYIQRYLAASGGVYFINPLVHELAALNQKPQLLKLKLYTTAFGRAVKIQKDVTEVVEKIEKDGKQKVDFQIVYLTRQSRQNSNLNQTDDKFMVNYTDGNGNTFPLYLESQNGIKELTEGITQACLSKSLKRDKYFDYLKRFSGRLSDRLSKLGQKETAKFYKDFKIDEFRSQIFDDAGINILERQKASKCVSSNEAAKQVLNDLIDSSKNKIFAAPTVVINDYYVLRGASQALIDILPEVLKTNRKPDFKKMSHIGHKH